MMLKEPFTQEDKRRFPMNEIENTSEYFTWIGELRKRYRLTQIKAAVSVNSALLEFYWGLGKDISERYPGKKRNAHFFAELCADLRMAMPEASGLSERNIRYMVDFFNLYSFREQVASDKTTPNRCLQQVVADKAEDGCSQQLVADNGAAARFVADSIFKIPWGHHILSGQLQGYVATCDMVLNTSQENPAIGLLVCRGKNAPLAKYLLGKIDMPLGVSDYEFLRKVPDDFKSQLPTVEEIEAELANMEIRYYGMSVEKRGQVPLSFEKEEK